MMICEQIMNVPQIANKHNVRSRLFINQIVKILMSYEDKKCIKTVLC